MLHKRPVISLIITLTLSFCMGGCSSLGPVRSVAQSGSSVFVAPTKVPTPTSEVALPAAGSTSDQPADCTNQLTFEQDLTLPDGTFIEPGSGLDKQWQVKNDGTCNWNENYSIHLINGDALGASDPQAMVPARSGTETTIRIMFTAPQEAGKYTSTWQAYDPNGQPFGDYFSIVINVIGQ